MKRGIAIAALVLASAYGLLIAFHYAAIQHDLKIRRAAEVHPVGDDSSASDGGMVIAVRREMNLRTGRFQLAWLIVIPATGRSYSCTWEEGSDGFEKGDSVTLLHNPPELNGRDMAAYVIGENRGKEDKVARVTPLELGDGANRNAAN